MRLLEISDDGTLSLTKDLISDDDIIPRYAILSHTWREDEEVTYDDFLDGCGEAKAGYEKIKFCHEAAVHDGLKHFWVDTCCINKRNPVELQDAINSMFRWYRDAAVCYVYLSDVSTTKRRASIECFRTTWEPAFRDSKWFTRGWTLQELLAPVSVKFYSKNRQYLGGRHELRQLIHEITNVPISALTGDSLRDFGMEERLSWSYTRTTTRREDRVYSLLGIFGIFMPLMYGEGYDSALQRLKKEVQERRYNTLASVNFSEQNWDCLRSLSFPEQEHRYNDVHVATDTCEWLSHEPGYMAWTRGTRGLFWIKGSPGTGKSVLMKHAFRSMAAQSPNDLTVSYFIHGQGSDLQKTPLGVFRALLNSLLGYFPARLTKATATFTDREKRFGGYTDGRWTWTCKELQELLLETLLDNLHDRRITIFIDALDECGEVPARDLLDYFSNLSRKAEEQAVDIRLCLSSRHYPVLGLDECPTISVEQKNTEDVEWYVKDRLRSIGSLPKRKRLQDELLTKASGGFQWVYLVTEALIIRNLTGKSLVGAVASCPQSLGAMYAALLSTESEEEDRQTIKLLLWVLLAERRLSAQELREAVATSPHMACTSVAQLRSHEDWSENLTDFERYVKHVSRGLIEFRTRDFWEQWEDSDREAQFVHQSVADFLRDSNAINKEQGTTGAGHFQISRSCLKYLTMGEILSEQGLTRDQLSSRFPLAPYAVRYVFAHIKKAEEAGLAQTDLLSVVKWPSEPETAHRLRSMWEKLNHTNAGTPPGWPFLDTPVLQVLAALGSKSAFFAALKEDVGAINKKDSDGNTPLHIAIALGHYDIALELLRQFHEKQQQDRSENDSEASGNAVRFLDIDAKNNEGETALDTAVAMKAEVVLTRLISLGANLKRLGQPHLLVRHAINNGDTELLATLIAGDIDLVGAVYFAIENSLSADIVQALAEGGGDINRLVIHEADNSDEDDYDDYERVEFRQTGGNALHLACRRGLDAEVRILLTNGASASARDLNGQCPLHIAVAFQSYYNAERTCSLETIACLLEYEPTAVEIEDYGGRSPLTALVQNFDASELEERKDLEVLGNLFLTKAQFSTPSVALTKLLLEYHEFWDLLGVEALETAALLSITKSLDIAAKNKRGQSIMWLAANRGFAALVDGLLARDSVDVNEVDDFATSPLLAAISRRHLAVVQSLLAVEGIDVNARNKLGRSPLHVAVEHETAEAQEVDVDHDIVALLFAARGIDIDAEDEHGLSPLVAAAESGCRVCVTRLLDAIGTDSDAPKNQVAYAHFAAMLADKREIAEMLAEFDRNGSSVLYTAVRTGSLDVVKRLVQQDNLKINVVDEEGNSPLRLAAEQHDKSIFKVLVDERRTNPDIEDGQGRSLLSWAAEVGNVTVVMTLLNTKRVNVNHLDPAGLTPLDKAQQNGHRMIAAILQAFTSGAQQMPYRVQHISYRGLSPALNDLDRYLDSL